MASHVSRDNETPASVIGQDTKVGNSSASFRAVIVSSVDNNGLVTHRVGVKGKNGDIKDNGQGALCCQNDTFVECR